MRRARAPAARARRSSTTKRAPEILPARAKSIMPQRLAERDVILRRESEIARRADAGARACCRSRPCRRARRRREDWECRREQRRRSRPGAAPPRLRAAPARPCSSATCCMSAPASPPLALAAPISLASWLRSAWSCSALVCAARQSWSSARSSRPAGGRPRRARPRSKASGSSRIQLDIEHGPRPLYRSLRRARPFAGLRVPPPRPRGFALGALLLDQLAGEIEISKRAAAARPATSG